MTDIPGFMEAWNTLAAAFGRQTRLYVDGLGWVRLADPVTQVLCDTPAACRSPRIQHNPFRKVTS